MESAKIKQINFEQLQEWKAKNVEFVLVDVREHDEHENYNIGGLLIPFADFLKKSGELPKDKPVVVYCQKGIRSTIVVQRLARLQDCSNFYNLEKGIQHLQGQQLS